MRLNNYKKKRILAIYALIIIISSSLLTISIFQSQKIYSDNKFGDSDSIDPRMAAQETLTAVWLENPTFEDPIEPIWYSQKGGDFSDVEATAGLGHVNLSVLGDKRTFTQVLGTPNSSSSPGWINVTNPAFPAPPDFNNIDEYGCEVSHTWIDPDDPIQSPSIHWVRNITMDVDMSDYIITSANISAVFNASVTTQPGGAGSPNPYYGVDTPNDSVDQPGDYDTARFYVQISDLERNEIYEIAWYQTIDLGQDDPEISNITDSFMNTVVQEALIFYLTSLFERDSYHFQITLGIRIKCVDNFNYDRDRWDSLRIKTCDLTFTYEKKVDQFTSISWNQHGNQISNISDTVILNEAKLNFKYKINDKWPNASPNSEIRAYINTNKLSETIKLSKANESFQIAKTGGFDVKSLIPYNTDINFSIQVYLADEFSLDRNITISLDDVYLNITYTVIFPDFQTNIQVFFNGINKTSNPIYDHPVGNDLNITVKYPDDTGNHIPGALVLLSGNLTGSLLEDPAHEQYTIIIDANDLDVGIIYFKIVAHKVNFELSTLSPIITVLPTETNELELFLNGDNMSSDPVIDVPLDSLLNITVKYNTLLGTPITGATVTLFGEGIIETLNESISLNQYSIIVNSSIKLNPGINLLTVEANKLNFEDQFKNPRITVRKINSVITAVNNSNAISIRPSEDINIQVYINNTDFNELIKGAIVTYTWNEESGLLQDIDNDGIYEADILDIPAGTHYIVINAFGSDKYNFVSLEFIIVASKPRPGSPLFLILLIIGIVISIGLGGYLYAYQKVLKYPKTVRKVRKFRKSLKRTRAPNVSILSREKAFNSAYKQELPKTIRFLKKKPKKEEEEESIEKIMEKEPLPPKVDLVSDSKNPNTNSYKPDDRTRNNKNTQRTFKRPFTLRIRNFWKNSLKMNKNGKIFYLIMILATLLLSSSILNPLFAQNLFKFPENSFYNVVNENLNGLGISAQESFTQQWLDNPNFTAPIEPTWFSSYGALGDNSDVNATTSPGQANYEILGEEKTFNEISGTPLITDWQQVHNPEFPLYPDTATINAQGCYVSHSFAELATQFPSVHWERNVSIVDDMSDYIITDANIAATVSGTVTASPGDWSGGGVECPGDATYSGIQNYTWDYARFYILLSDLNKDKVYEIAYNQTVDLGKDSAGATDSMPSTFMTTVPKEALIFYLSSVLGSDNHNFTITLGIRIWCEDNWISDRDIWNSLYIESCNLTFTYVKRINQFTSVSWNQNADKISDISNDTVVVNKAILNFKYKTNATWPNTSPNSEIRILINDNLHTETIKLVDANTTFQEAKVGGFDITSLIIDDVNLSIQIYIADEFGNNRTIVISIDEVYLDLTYTIIFPDKETEIHLFLNSVNKTDDPDIDIFIGDSLNITIKYLNMSKVHIPNATVQVTGNFTGFLKEDEILEQYTIILNTTVADAGINFLTITAQAEDHYSKVIDLIVRINKFPTEDLQVILNRQNVTQDPFIELTVSEILNVTLKYKLLNGSHISGATILLSSETFTSYINESITFEQYSILIDTNQSLKTGTNLLRVTAQTESLEAKIVDITVSVKRINVQIEPATGTNTIETKTGTDVFVRIRLNNTDFGGFITGAIVTYSWEGRVGILEDLNDDGIYEATMPNVPEGTSPIEISAFIGDNYFVEDYVIVIAATSEVVPENPLFPILFVVSMIVIGALAIYLYAYQTYLKFPKQVRKVRKFRKSLKYKTAPKTPIIGKETAFKIAYNENLGKSTSDLKLKRHPGVIKPKVQKIPSDKGPEKPLEEPMEPNQLTEKILEKKEELDKLVKDSNSNTPNI
ncbi:MAG: hypothetical protein ACFFCV_20805 [Promethearchaeota archaeon]